MGATPCKKLANMKKQQKHSNWGPMNPLSIQRVKFSPKFSTNDRFIMSKK